MRHFLVVLLAVFCSSGALAQGLVGMEKQILPMTKANWLAFRSLFELVTPDHVLFGSDYPFAPEPTMTGSIKALQEMGLDPDVLQGIERDNALKLFPQFGA